MSHEPMQHAANVARTCNTHTHTLLCGICQGSDWAHGDMHHVLHKCSGETVPHWLGGGMPPRRQLPGQRRWANREKVKVAKKCPHGKTGLCNLCPHDFSGQRSICSVLCYRAGERDVLVARLRDKATRRLRTTKKATRNANPLQQAICTEHRAPWLSP